MHLNLFSRCFSTTSNSLLKHIDHMAKKKMYQASKKPFTIVVEGNIGSGKTTFLNNFKNHESILTLTEPVEAWKNLDGHNLLSLLYSDINKWAFTFQTYVQMTMMKLHGLKTDKPVKLMERSLYSCRYVFIENLHKSKILLSPEVAVLDEWFKWLVSKNSFSVDLIVYLRTDPDVAYQRIKKRCRQGEELIKFDYLEKLHECHEDWLCRKTKFSCPAPVLLLDANKDLEGIKEEYSHFKSQLQELNTLTEM